MTNRERILSLIGFSPNNDNAIIGSLADLGLSATDTYTPLNRVPVIKATIEVMNILLTTANTTDAASQFYITYDRNAVLERIKSLSGEIGSTDGSLPVINRVARW